MVTNKQRQRQLARAKWERQQSKRTHVQRRQRTVNIVVGVIGGIIVTGLLVWLVLHILNQENARNPQTPAIPTDTFKTNLLSPPTPGLTQTTPASGGATTTPRSTSPKTSKTSRTSLTPKPTSSGRATKTGGNQ